MDNNEIKIKIILSLIACVGILFFFGKTFYLPIRKGIKVVINSFLGGVLIFVINLIGISFNFHIGLNVLNSIVVGVLGIPGAILLIICKIFI